MPAFRFGANGENVAAQMCARLKRFYCVAVSNTAGKHITSYAENGLICLCGKTPPLSNT